MKIHKEGYTTIALTILFIFVLNAVIDYYFAATPWVRWLTYIISAILFLTVLQFFRSPSRRFTTGAASVICPADGKVVVIEETYEDEYFKDKRLQLSIFMNPVNVHVNRNPISGRVVFYRYHPGKKLVAWHPKSSTLNERTTVVVQQPSGTRVLFRQIAGALARRIVCYVKEGDEVQQSQEFGFIKFGSRVDVFLPLGTQVNVSLNQVVKGGITTLATLMPPAENS